MAATNKSYYIPFGALIIRPNSYNSSPNYISVSLANGAIIRAFYPHISHDGDYPLGYAADGTSYRSWLLEAYNTILSDTEIGHDVYVYARLNTQHKALIVFSGQDPQMMKATCQEFLNDKGKSVKWNAEPDASGCWWVWIGTLRYGTSGYTVDIDSGVLGTDAGNDSKDTAAFTYNTLTLEVGMNKDWKFDEVRTQKLTFVPGRGSADAITKGDTKEDENSGTMLATTSWVQRVGSAIRKWAEGAFLWVIGKDFQTIAGSINVEGNISTTDLTATNVTASDTVKSPNIEATKSMKTPTLTVTGTATVTQLNSQNIQNSGDILTKNLKVTGTAEFAELIIQKIKAAGGATLYTPADGFKVDKAELCEWTMSREGAVIIRPDNYDESFIHGALRVVLYWRAEVDGQSSQNMWKIGDQAICMNFNGAKVGVNTDISNKYWWSVVEYASEEPVVVELGPSDEALCHYIIIHTSGTDYSGTPNIDGKLLKFDGYEPVGTVVEVGDSIAMLGHRPTQLELEDTEDTSPLASREWFRRGNAIYISAYSGLDIGYTDVDKGISIRALIAPFYAQYRGIRDFNLALYRKTFFDASGSKFVGDFVSESDGTEYELYEWVEQNRISVQLGRTSVFFDKSSKAQSQSISVSVYRGSTKLDYNDFVLSLEYAGTQSDRVSFVNENTNFDINVAASSTPKGVVNATISVGTYRTVVPVTLECIDNTVMTDAFTKYAVTEGYTRPSQTDNAWNSNFPSSIPNGHYLWTWSHTEYSDGTKYDSYSVSRQGIDGNGFQKTDVRYCVKPDTSVSPESFAETDWLKFPTDMTDGYWLYTRTVITYSDTTTSTSYTSSQIGTGAYAGTQEYYAVANSDKELPSDAKYKHPSEGSFSGDLSAAVGSAWSEGSRPPYTDTDIYLWNFEISQDTRGNKYVTKPIYVGNLSKGIESFIESYAISQYNVPAKESNVPADISESDWVDEHFDAAPTEERPYQWNRTVIQYSDGTHDEFYHISATFSKGVGRQLLLGTNQGNTGWVATVHEPDIVTISSEGEGVTFNSSRICDSWQVYSYPVPDSVVSNLVPKGKYVVSFDYKSSVNFEGDGPKVMICQTDMKHQNTDYVRWTAKSDNEWHHVAVVLTVNDAIDLGEKTQMIYFGNMRGIGEITFKNLKLEEGLIGTAWCLAEEEKIGAQGVPGKPGADGQTYYTWIRYADDAEGNNISNTPTGKEYIGFAYNKTTAIESDNSADYTWSLIKGTDGVPGVNGSDGKTYYTWIQYADIPDPKNESDMYQLPRKSTKYIGIAINKETSEEGSDPTEYTWSKWVGDDGADGTSFRSNLYRNSSFSSIKNETGPDIRISDDKYGQYNVIGVKWVDNEWKQGWLRILAGKAMSEPWVAGETYTLSAWFKGVFKSGSSKRFLMVAADKSHLWLDSTKEETKTVTAEWSHHSITFVAKGNPSSASGDYIDFARLTSGDSWNDGSTLLVACPKIERGTEATDWCLGEEDKTTGITDSFVKYAVSKSASSKPADADFSEEEPVLEDGDYLWTWTHVRYSDGKETNAYSVSKTGIDGRGIKSAPITYAMLEEYAQPDTIKEWGAYPDSLTEGWWLYTRTSITYSDSDTPVHSYSVSKIGAGVYYAGTQEYYAVADSETELPATDEYRHPDEGLFAGSIDELSELVGTEWILGSRPSYTVGKVYLWNFEVSADSSGKFYVTQPVCVGNFAKGISSFVESYATSAENTPPKGADFPSDIEEKDWTDEQYDAAPTEQRPYQWNRTQTLYNDGTSSNRYHISAAYIKGIGRQLLVGTNQGKKNWAHTTEINGLVTIESDGECVKFTSTGRDTATDSYPKYQVYEFLINNDTVRRLTPNGKYVLSFDYKSTVKKDGATIYPQVMICQANMNKETQNTDYVQWTAKPDDEWHHVSVVLTVKETINVTDTQQFIYFGGVMGKGSIMFKNMKFEEGIIGTAWCLAEEEKIGADGKDGKNGKDGADGKNVVMLDISNEMDSFSTDSRGKLNAGDTISTELHLYDGDKEVRIASVRFTCDNYNLYPGSNALFNVAFAGTMSGVGGTVTVTARDSAVLFTKISHINIYVVAPDGVEHMNTLTVVPSMGTAVYGIRCGVNAVSVNATGAVIPSSAASSGVSVYVDRKEQSGVVSGVDWTAEGLILVYSKNGASVDSATEVAYSSRGSHSGTISNNDTSLTFYLLKDGVIIDQETIPVVKDGTNGGRGADMRANLYRNSSFAAGLMDETTLSVGGTPACQVSSDKFGLYNSMLLGYVSNTYDHVYLRILAMKAISEPWIPGETYTFSAWYKADVAGDFRFVAYNQGSSWLKMNINEVHTVGTEWERISVSFVCNSATPGTSYIDIARVYDTSRTAYAKYARNVYIACPKIERGTEATDWCLSEDDKSVKMFPPVVKYAISDDGDAAPSSGWQTTMPPAEKGKFMWTWTHTEYSDGNSSDAYSVSRIGVDGGGILDVDISYCLRETNGWSPEILPESSWGKYPNPLTEGYWLYTRIITYYTDGKRSYEYKVNQVGVGSHYAGCSEYYALSEFESVAPADAPDPGTYTSSKSPSIGANWQTTRPLYSSDVSKPYLWNFEISRDSAGNQYVTSPICIGNLSKGMKSLQEWYAISEYSSPDDDGEYPSDIASDDWTYEQEDAAPTDEKPYQWNKTVVEYNVGDPDVFYHVSAVKGDKGPKGDDAFEVVPSATSLVFNCKDDGTITETSGLPVTISVRRGGESIPASKPSSGFYFSASVVECVNATVGAQTQADNSYTFVVKHSGTDTVTGISDSKFNLPSTNGSVKIKVSIYASSSSSPAEERYITIPYSVEIKSFHKHYFEHTDKQFQSLYTSIETQEDTIKTQQTQIKQTAEKIGLLASEQETLRKEYGDVQTSVQSAINLIPDRITAEVTTSVKYLPKGSNMLGGTNFANIRSNFWQVNTDEVRLVGYGDESVVRIQLLSGRTNPAPSVIWCANTASFPRHANVPVKPRTRYTLSFMVRSNSIYSGGIIQIGARGSEFGDRLTEAVVAHSSYKSVSGWSRVTFTFDTSSHSWIDVTIGVRRDDFGTNALEIKQVMLNEGDQASEWSVSGLEYVYERGNLLPNSYDLSLEMDSNGDGLTQRNGDWAMGTNGQPFFIKSQGYATVLAWSIQPIGRSTFTCSFVAKADTAGRELTVSVRGYDGTNGNLPITDGYASNGKYSDTSSWTVGLSVNFAISTDWQVYTFCFLTRDVQSSIKKWSIIFGGTNSAGVSIKTPKLEVGPVYTGYTSSPTSTIVYAPDNSAQLSRTGIDIEVCKIDMQADNFTLRNNAGEVTLSADKDHNVAIHNGSLTFSNADKPSLVINESGDGLVAYYYPDGSKMRIDEWIIDDDGNYIGVLTRYFDKNGRCTGTLDYRGWTSISMAAWIPERTAYFTDRDTMVNTVRRLFNTSIDNGIFTFNVSPIYDFAMYQPSEEETNEAFLACKGLFVKADKGFDYNWSPLLSEVGRYKVSGYVLEKSHILIERSTLGGYSANVRYTEYSNGVKVATQSIPCIRNANSGNVFDTELSPSISASHVANM